MSTILDSTFLLPAHHLYSAAPLESEIQSRVAVILRSSSYRQVQQVQCEIFPGCIVLRGVVDSFYLKQIAQSLLRELLLAGWRIENSIEVRWTI